MEDLAVHDREALLDQAVRKESLALGVRSPRDPAWREHLLDAIEAYDRIGFVDAANAVRAHLGLPPAAPAAEPAAEAAYEPEDGADEGEG